MSTVPDDSEPIPLGNDKMVDNSDFIRLERKVDKLIESLGKLLIVEDRQIAQSARITELEKDLAVATKQFDDLEKKVEQWINRGVGAWFVAGLVWATVQFILPLKH
jgi:hypothetical protein